LLIPSSPSATRVNGTSKNATISAAVISSSEVEAEHLSEQSNIKLQRLDTQKQLAETRALYGFCQNDSPGAALAQTSALDAGILGSIGCEPSTESNFSLSGL